MSIDFVSTRQGVDIQSKRCAHLLSAVIAQALKDLMQKPTAQERKNRININPNVIRSISFFNSKTFVSYANLIGMDANEFMNRAIYGRISGKQIPESDVRIMRARLRWRCSADVPPLPTSQEDVSDEKAWEEESLEKEFKKFKKKVDYI